MTHPLSAYRRATSKRNTCRSTLLLTALVAMASVAYPQQPATPLPEAPATEADFSLSAEPFHRTPLPMPPKPPQEPSGAYGYLYRGSLGCGAGAAHSSLDQKPAIACGLGMTIFPMVVTEVGVMGPALNRVGFSVYFSEDATIPITLPKTFTRRVHGHPIVLAGYTRMFETGRNSFDYGVGFERHIDEQHTLQFEMRDYWTFATPQQHNVMLRIVWITGIPD